MDTKNAAPGQPDAGVNHSQNEGSDALAVNEPVAWYLHHAVAAEDRADVRSKARDNFMRLFAQRCKAARGGREILEVSMRVGVHRNTIWSIERGDTLPDAFLLEVLAREYGTTTAHLLEGEPHEKALPMESVQKSVQAVQVDGFIYVPLFDINVSAGCGAFNDVESVVAMRPFDANYIRYELGISHNHIAMTAVVGRSMEPWLRPKDTVLIDLKDREAMSEGVHIVRLDGALLVKNLQRLPGKVLRVSSYNTAYEPFDIQGHEDRDRDFEVIGRVRWAGVTFN